ncbi:hypothetical protein [Enterovibrio coralii]|uniref:Uncharacterized protein n=1 Tax=Enterovibrio coralii TaxID=294935 RepID=A0A135ICA1_9GAMM|nr:hypothetical protein [Enterovibrio coralii]KXF83093.1 hypothetical protein ATN88_05080 [Enterovibrio coralii]
MHPLASKLAQSLKITIKRQNIVPEIWRFNEKTLGFIDGFFNIESKTRSPAMLLGIQPQIMSLILPKLLGGKMTFLLRVLTCPAN